MVLTNKVYTTQSFLEAITGNHYVLNDIDNDLEFIHNVLYNEGYEDDEDHTLWDYLLTDIDEIIHNELNVVLVEVGYFDSDYELIKEYRWFEVPEECIDAFTKQNN